MNKIVKNFFLLIIVSFLFSEPYEEYKVGKNYELIKLLDNQIVIDGKLDDPDWNHAKELSDFMSINYSSQEVPSRETSVKIVCDSDNIYIGVKLYDNSEEITFKSGSYDDFIDTFDLNSDYFIVEFDSDHDHQTSYAFAVNSSNVQSDYLVYDDDYIDDNWNAEWTSKVFVDNFGWSIEYKIPVDIFRFSKNTNQTWGLNLIRYIKRNNEYMAWVVLPEEKVGIVSQYGHLNNIIFKQKSSFNIRPYFAYDNQKYDDQYYPYLLEGNDGNISGLDFSSGQDIYLLNESNNKLGFDLNYNPNSFSAIDMTYKPDFGQINQDASEINNTAYETYYDEKRSFFIENSLFFETPIKVFYSRRIGDYIKSNNINIRTELNTALKYTSIINNYNYGFLFAYTNPKDNDLIDNKIYSTIFRINKSIINNNFKIGFIGTNYNHEYKNSNVYGLDYVLSLLDKKLIINSQSILSDNNLDKGYGLNFDLSYRTDVFSVFNNNDLFLDFWIKNNQYDKSLDIDDLGYLFRNNLKEINLGFSINNYKSLNKSKYIIQYYRAENYSKDVISNVFSLNYNIILNDLVAFDIGISQEGDHYNDKYYDDYYNLDLNKIIKTPNDMVLTFNYNNNKSDIFSYSINLNKFKNNINDKGNNILFDIVFKPAAWIDLSFSYDRLDYYETYHFLKIRQLPSGINLFNNSYNFFSNRDTYSYLFINSNNLEVYYTGQLSAYYNNNLSFQLYGEYFIHRDNWDENSDLYEIKQTDENFIYPNLITGLSSELINFDNDKIKYSSLYNSLMLNLVTKWNFNKSSSMYFVYSLSKGVNGKIFSNPKDLIEFDNNDNLDNVKAEIFYNHNATIKIEFYF